MNIPKNVLWFEVLLYLSLALDALSVAFQDRTPSVQMTESMITVATVMAACLILLLVFFVWLAAQRRKNWPRWALVASLVLSVISLVQIVGDGGGVVFFLHRRRARLVQRVTISCTAIPGRASEREPGILGFPDVQLHI